MKYQIKKHHPMPTQLSPSTEITDKQLLLSDMTGFPSDGAAVFLGKKNGVAKKLKDSNTSLITTHCRDHRLALACRDSFKAIPVMRRLMRPQRNFTSTTNTVVTTQPVSTQYRQPSTKHHSPLSKPNTTYGYPMTRQSPVLFVLTSPS